MNTMKSLVSKGAGLAIVTVLIASGCGGGGSSKTTQEATTPTAASAGGTATGTTGAPATTAKAAGGSTPTIPGSSASADSVSSAIVAAFKAVANGDCDKAKALGNGDFGLGGSNGLGSNTITAVASATDSLAKSGPSELRTDFATMSKAFSALATAYKNLGIDDPSKIPTIAKDPTKLAELEKASKILDDDAFSAASDRIDAWIEKKCPGLTK